jgi:ssDNA-binding Zn-finger/Zn-ribbon topoisomerase 1
MYIGRAYAEDQGVERIGQIQQSFAPVSQRHQGRKQHQESIDAGASTVRLTSAAAASMRRTKSQKENLDVPTFETFKPKLEGKRSISWSSAWETTAIAASRSTDSQIYDTVKPVTAAKVKADERDLGFSKLSYLGCPMKDPLPSCTDTDKPSASDSESMLYASLCADSCDLGSAYDVPNKAALAYAVPDVKMKRAKKQGSKEWNDEAIINPEEMLMFNNFCGHYDTPKCKYTAEKEITANRNVGSLYDQPRIIKPNLGN